SGFEMCDEFRSDDLRKATERPGLLGLVVSVVNVPATMNCVSICGSPDLPACTCNRGDRQRQEPSTRVRCVYPSHSLIVRPNAPVHARWAHAQRAGPRPPNTPTVARTRLLGSSLY